MTATHAHSTRSSEGSSISKRLGISEARVHRILPKDLGLHA